MTPVLERAAVAFARDLARHGDRTALVCAERRLSYAELADEVARMSQRVGAGRQLVVIEAANEVEPIVAYLACLAAGHVALLAPAGTPDRAFDTQSAQIVAAYRPDTVFSRGPHGWGLRRSGGTGGTDLHPDLALLLSTSGSSGSPKMVRLSHENLQSNAEAICAYLGIGPEDRAPTTLPLSYSYGLSVLNSHLAAGAGVIVTGYSVVDECFWELMAAERATSLAGVPYTFELLEAAGFADRPLPDLRRVTQAGGRMAAQRVRRMAGLAGRRGFDFYVMYGQTEACARIAYLPPGLAADHPDCIGVAIPGGELRLDPAAEHGHGVGELVYRGPNVMLGYADGAADLGRGREQHELRTGDLAEQTPDGLFRIVGRRSRVAKPFGLRIDLDRLELQLADEGCAALCVELPDGLGVLLAHGSPDARDDGSAAAARTARLTGVPQHAIRVVLQPDLPVNGNGKPDYAEALRRCTAGPCARPGCMEAGCPAATAPAAAASDRVPAAAAHPEADVAAILGRVLGSGPVGPGDSFVSLGGDSLSYVAAAAALEERLGRLPSDWPRRSVADLAHLASQPETRPGTAHVETPVLLRAAAVVLVVGSHIGTFDVRGGAHLLLGLAGYSFARFHLAGRVGRERVRAVAASTVRLAALCLLWLVPLVLISGEYGPSVLLVNNLLGPDADSPEWRYWFVEALVYVTAGAAALIALPAVHRLEQRHPFGFPMGLTAAAAAVALATAADAGPASMYTPVAAAWLFCAGWALARADGWRRKALVLATVAAVAPMFFNRPDRVGLVLAGLALVAATVHVPVPRVVAQPVQALAAASLAVYLSHYQVYPLFADSPWLALVVSLSAGAALWHAVIRLAAVAGPRRRRPAGAPAVAGTG